MKARAVTHVVLAAALASPASLTGCSFLGSTPPPKTPLVSGDQCSDNRLPPAADTVWMATTGSFALLFWGLAALQDQDNRTTVVPSWDQRRLSVDKSLLVAGGAFTAATIAFFASARYGNRSVFDCDVARGELMLRTPPLAWPPASQPAWQPGAAYPYPYRYSYPSPYAYPYPHPPGAAPLPPGTASLPPGAAPLPLLLPPPPTPAVKRSAHVVAPSAQVRSAPFDVAPVVVVLAKGQSLLVDETPQASWRAATLSDGRAGYIQDAQVEVDSP